MRKYNNRTFTFTEEKVKEVCKFKAGVWYSDALCKGLRVQTLLHGNGSYVYQAYNKCKTIGNVHRISLEQARDIAFNITANIDEFLSLDIKDKYIVEDFEKNGFLPRKKIEVNGTEVIISNENASLKEKIKDLQTETVLEVCPECDCEVELKDAKLKTPQKCPNCGKYIMSCNLCYECDCDNSCGWQNLNRITGKIDKGEEQ